jgi:hypothetical protein
MSKELTGKDTCDGHIIGSMSGLAKMNPQGKLNIKSFQGLANLKPSAQSTTIQSPKNSGAQSSQNNQSQSNSSASQNSGKSDKK